MLRRQIDHRPHPEEAALFCAAVSKDGYAHSLVPSFETPTFGRLLRLYVPFLAEATHPRCGFEGYPE
jgi:hypothetical protein